LKLYEKVKYYWLGIDDAVTFLLDVTNVIHKTLTLQLCHTNCSFSEQWTWTAIKTHKLTYYMTSVFENTTCKYHMSVTDDCQQSANRACKIYQQ